MSKTTVGNVVKPGVKTTEFWMSTLMALVGPIVTVLVSVGIFAQEDAAAVTGNSEAIVQSVVVLVGNVTSLFAVRGYVKSRTEVKNTR